MLHRLDIRRSAEGEALSGQLLAGGGHAEAAEDGDHAKAARVDHTGFAEAWELLRGTRERLLRCPLSDRQHVHDSRGGVCDDRARPGAEDGEHCALHGRAHGLVGDLGGVLEGTGEVGRGRDLQAGQRLSGAAHHLGEDDAAVAACAQQRAARDPLGQQADARLRTYGLACAQAGAEGEEHVGAGVTVRDGVHVDGIDGVAVERQPTFRRRERAAQLGGGEHLVVRHPCSR